MGIHTIGGFKNSHVVQHGIVKILSKGKRHGVNRGLDKRHAPVLVIEHVEDVEEEMRAVLERVRAGRPGFDYDIRELHRVLPTMTERDAPVVTSVADAVREVFGREADYVVSPGTYDQKHIDRIGKLKNCIAYGPGILDLAHKPDEYVGIDDMIQSAQVMALALNDLLGPQQDAW